MGELLKELKNEAPLETLFSTIGAMLWNNAKDFAPNPVFGEKSPIAAVPLPQNKGAPHHTHQYHYVTWGQFIQDLAKVVGFLREQNILLGDRVGVIAGNHYQRFVTEMAILASGRVCVPLFAGYGLELLEQLISFSDLKGLFLDGTPKLQSLSPKYLPATRIVFDHHESYAAKNKNKYFPFTAILASPGSKEKLDLLDKQISGVTGKMTAFIMYTSGTSNFPKGVMLTQSNIMSQQMALLKLWQPEKGMKFLSYLPWHHSFGGLFERFFALTTGGSIAVDDSLGKDTELLLKNFAAVKPHVFFSVPKIYQEIVSQVMGSSEVEHDFFHPGLKFVFTAAASLPLNISHVFKNKNMPVIEGWGLTETSPCCTLTDFSLERKQGLVGKPIPGVSLKIAEDGEILVKGPNVMTGYFKNEAATAKVFDSEGYFKTGDIGEISAEGLKILSRKDRVFKMSNGEKVYPSTIEEALCKKCKLIKYAFVFGQSESQLYALLFPNFEFFSAKEISVSLADPGCAYPKNLELLCGCLKGCVTTINQQNPVRYEKIKKALIINRELSLDDHEITPSFKLVPRTIEERYKKYISALLEGREQELSNDCWLISVD